MSVGASRDLEELFRLNIAFDTANNVIIETKNFSDRARGIRQVRTVKRWKNTTCLGRGTSGKVWLQVEEGAEENCRAVKEIVKGTSTAPLPVNYRRELLALGRLSKRDDIFVQFFGWYEDSWSVYIVMEYFEHGDLGRHLSTPLAESDAKVISKQLLEGLAVLHGQNWAHRDLKPANIFVVEKSPWWVKLGDFGISKRIRSGNTRFQTMIGTLEFLAPEVLHLISQESEDDSSDEEDEYTVAVDMWSLGCVIYQILTMEVPFANRRKLRSYCRPKVDKFPIAPLRRFDASVAAVGILKELLEPSPSARMTADAALGHAWVEEAREISESRRRSLQASVNNADIGLSMQTGQEDGLEIDKEAGIKAGPENDPSSPGIFKTFRVKMEDPCYRVLPAALRKYNITDDWRKYALWIVYGDQERCLGLDEKPLILFKHLNKEGRNPMFMIRKHAPPEKGSNVGTSHTTEEAALVSTEAGQDQRHAAGSPPNIVPSWDHPNIAEQSATPTPDLDNWF